LTPLEYFQRQCYGAVECDEITPKHIPEYGLEDNMVFSTDYPPRRQYPHAIDSFLKLPFSDQTKRKYLWTTACGCTISETRLILLEAYQSTMFYLSFRTLDDLVHFEDVGAGKISARGRFPGASLNSALSVQAWNEDSSFQ
jgi:hypothetical protein